MVSLMPNTKTCIDCGENDTLPSRRVCKRCNYLRKKASVDRWKERHPERVRHLANKSRYNRYGPARAAAVIALGGVCQRCGFADERALEIDHANGGGTRERTTKDRITFYKEVAAGRRDVQLLCLNCHRIKSVEERH